MILSKMNRFATALAMMALLAACQSQDSATAPADTAASPDSETARLNAWLDERYEEQLQFSPMDLTILGRKDQYDAIDDASEQAARDQAAWGMRTVEELQANFNRDSLTAAGKESYDYWIFRAERTNEDLEFLRHEYLFAELRGFEDEYPTFLINYHRVDDEADMRAYITRIGGIARAVDQNVEKAKTRAAEGFRPPRFAYEVALSRAEKVISGAPFNGSSDSPLLADASAKIDALLAEEKIDDDTARDLLDDVTAALTVQLEPAYLSFIEWLAADVPNSDQEARGVWALPNGEAYYKNRLANYTTLPMTADDVHELGLAEVSRILGEMEEIRASVDFDGDLQAFFEFIRTDPQFYYPNTDEGREGYLSDTRDFLADIEEKLPEYFGILPKAELVVRRVEAFREIDGGAQHYARGTPDGSRPGVYYVHMSDMSAMSKPDMETVAYHEASPGHHMQISIAQELTGVPVFRTQGGQTVYVEGWALYSEKLAKEMGQFKDPYQDFGRLTAEMWRAIRLVVDTGMHAKGWTQEQAVQYFFENSAIPETAVRSEVRRYLTYPGQATSYKIGMLKIEELRQRAEEALGDQFDIRSFHDTILGGGSLPIPLLESRVDNWIAAQQN